MQKEYINLGTTKVFNGNYMLAVFYIETYNNQDLLSAASEIAAESSTGTNKRVNTVTPFSDELNAIVYKINEEKNLAYIAYPFRIFDRGGNIQNIMTFIAGNIFGMSNLKACKLLDIHFPTAMFPHYDGPSVNIDDLRRYLNNYHKPILGTIIKPKIGLTPNEYAEVCYDFWSAGGHFVKNDEPQADQEFAPFAKSVTAVKEAMQKAEDKTGETKIHSFNISSADFDTMIKRAEYIINTMPKGSYAFLVDGITAGWTAVQTIRRRFPDVFLHFHRAGHGAFTRAENPIGFSVPVLTKMARLAGASGIHTGTAGIGKMADGIHNDDIISAHIALKLKSEGLYFDQIWSEIPENDEDTQKAIKEEEELWSQGPLNLSRKRYKAQKLEEYWPEWRVIKKTTPIASGGLTPLSLAPFIEKVGTIDFITTMGGGIHSHPEGTSSGVKAVLQAFDAWYNQIPIDEYAKEHRELELAIEKFQK